MSERDRSIDDVFAEGTPIDRAATRAVRQAVRRHKLLGNPVAVWQDGKVVWIPPAQIVIEDDDEGPPVGR